MHVLTFPVALFRQTLRALALDRHRPVSVAVALHRRSDRHEWLARSASPIGDPTSRERLLRVTIGTISDSSTDLVRPAFPVVGELRFVVPSRGVAAGAVRMDSGLELLHTLSLVGPGMYRIRLAGASPATDRPAQQLMMASAYGHWSRTIGALGGLVTWKRLADLRIALVGCGRTGSLLAVMLKRVGVREIALVDPDLIELHNCGEMDQVDWHDVGAAKADALARRLERISLPGSSSIIPLVATADDPAALSAIKSADIVVCCADSDAARLSAAIVSTLYHKVLIDLGTGVLRTQGGAGGHRDSAANAAPPQVTGRTMGADVRLVIPGDGCLLCRGNLSNYAQAMHDLINGQPAHSVEVGKTARREGSLRSLNQLAAAVAMRMLEDLVSEAIVTTTWARLQYDAFGRLSVMYPEMQGGSDACTLCAKAGLGDEATSMAAGL